MATVTAVGAPATLDTLTVTALRKEAIDNSLRMDVIIDDVYEQFGGDVISDPEGMHIPDSIYLRLSAGADGSKGANSVTVGMLLNLTGDLVLGDTVVSGTEETQDLRSFTMYYEEYAYAVASTKFGRNANEMGMYGVFEKIQPQISFYMGEMHGMRVREASLQGNDHVLQNLSTISAHWNSNWFIANANPAMVPATGAIDGFGQPVFDATTTGATSMTEIIADVMEGAAPAADTDAATGANISIPYLTSLEFYARTEKNIEPIGGDKYVCVLPSSQVKILKDNTTNMLGEIFVDQHRKSTDGKVGYTFKLGTVGQLELYSDDRYPTVLMAGANGSYTLTPSYVKPGKVDTRVKAVHETATNRNWDIGFLYGKGAICEWEVTPLHFEDESQDYGKRLGTGAFGESGIRLVEYDIDGGWAGTTDGRYNIGSIALAFTTPSITA